MLRPRPRPDSVSLRPNLRRAVSQCNNYVLQTVVTSFDPKLQVPSEQVDHGQIGNAVSSTNPLRLNSFGLVSNAPTVASFSAV